MHQYLEIMNRALVTGQDHEDRTGVGRISIFGTQERYNLASGFPLVTTRAIPIAPMVKELLWFISGSTNITATNGPKFWDKWAVSKESIKNFANKVVENDQDTEEDKEALSDAICANYEDMIGEIGPMYGAIWRNAMVSPGADRPPRTLEQLPSDKLKRWNEEYEELVFLARDEKVPTLEHYASTRYNQTVDQLNELIINLKERPHSSRHCITAWVPGLVPPETVSPQTAVLMGFGALAPCHAFFQFFVRKDVGDAKILDCQLYLRSSDLAIGRPFNIAQYALLQSMIAQVVGMTPGEFILTTGDSHIYTNQVEGYGARIGVETQLQREPRKLPTLWLNPEVKDLFKFTEEDIAIFNYNPHPAINYNVSV